jgi:hypothetical protein
VRKYSHLVVTALLLSSLNASAFSEQSHLNASDPVNQRQIICCQYDQMNKAFAAGNIDSVKQMLAPTYTEIDPDGKKLDRKSLCSKLEFERKQITSVTQQYTITKIDAKPNEIVVDLRTHSSGTGAKKILFMTVHGKFINDMVLQDTWTWRHTYFDESHQSAG